MRAEDGGVDGRGEAEVIRVDNQARARSGWTGGGTSRSAVVWELRPARWRIQDWAIKASLCGLLSLSGGPKTLKWPRSSFCSNRQ